MESPLPTDSLAYDLQEWASEYATKSAGIMTVLPHDPEQYPAQDSGRTSISGEPQDIGIIDTIALIAQPKYGELVADLRSQEALNQRIAMAGELLGEGNNVIISTNHGDLIDIAVTHAAVYAELVRQGHEPRTGIIISKMISYLAYRLGEEFVPCTNVLEILEHDTFLSYPKTESTKKHLRDRIIPSEADRHNKRLRKDLHQKLGEGGLLLAMAASGTTDKPLDGDPTTIGMGKLGAGTMDILSAERTYTLPLAVWYKHGHTILRPADIPRRITSKEKAHHMMQKIAGLLTKTTEDTTFVYS